MRNLLIIFIFFYSQFSFAENTVYYVGSNSSSARYTPEEACQAPGMDYPGFTYHSVVLKPNGFDYKCMIKNNSSGSVEDLYIAVYNYATCSDGYKFNLVNRGCEVYTPPPPPDCPSNIPSNFGWSQDVAKSQVCFKSCSYKSVGTQVHYSGGGAGMFRSNGQSCSGPDTGSPDPGTCPSGTTNISSNPLVINCSADKPSVPKCWVGSTNVSADPDVAVCVSDSTSKTGPDDPTTHVPDSTKTPDVKVVSSVEPTSDGGVKTTVTTTTTTTNTDGSTSISSNTKVTNTSPDGSVKTTTDTNKVQDKSKSFCELNPQLTICRNSLVSGDCASLNIDGDAIQGAILRQQKKEYCDNLVDSSIKDLGLALIANTDPMQAQFPTIDNATVVDLSNIGNLDSSGFLSGGSCFTDKSFAVAGVTVKLPISILCDYLTPLRLAVMLLALMASYKMIAGTVLRDL